MEEIKDVKEMELVKYGNTGTTAYCDSKHYYNEYGQELRNSDEYNQHSEGYTPFGDE